MKKIKWIEIVEKIFDTNGLEYPIHYESEEYGFTIYGDKEKLIGFMTVWNINSLRAIHLSRVHLNKNLNFKSFNDDLDERVPKNLIFEDIASSS